MPPAPRPAPIVVAVIVVVIVVVGAFSLILSCGGLRVQIIAIGAPHDVLVDEAQQMKLLMRMQETKGTMEFHQDLLRYYATNHGGLNEYIPGPPTGPDGEPLENYPTDDYHQGPHLRQREPAMLEQHWKYDEELSAEELEQRQMRAQSVFSSSIAQRLVMSRLVRLGRYDPDHQMQLAAKDTKGLPADRRALGHVSNRSVVKHRDIPASLLHDLLTLFGGYRPQNQAVFPMARGEPVIAHLAKQVQADDQFILKTSGLDSHKKSSAGAPDALTYDHVVDCVSILERWRDGRGRKEIWFGTLAAYFPLHLENELKYLKNEWGNPKMLFSGSIIGYNPEGEPKERLVEGEEPEVEHNTMGAAKNRLQVHRFPLSLVYQPIEEIRDYFGDDVGLYFSWLGVYTKALFVMSLTGLVVMGVQPYASDCDFFGCGVARNPLTVYYTIYVGIWSTLFIESWHRRENELRFLWGTEKLSQIEQPRPAFVGELDTNPETGRQLLVVKSPAEQYMKIFLSTLMSVGFIIFTVASAIAAQMVKYIEPDGEGLLEQKKYEMAAAALNLAIIAIYGSLFEKLADALTEWENHRTQSEFDNSRVGKNFLFQFVNNYFVLFYISYLREIKDPISKAAHPCQYGNCLPELQVQLIVVFTGKTLGKQFAYTLKPFIYKWKKQCKDNSMTKSIVKNASKGTSMMPASMKSAMDQVGNLAEGGGQGDPRHQLKALKNVRNPYELQARLMPYQGTFADFNDRVIQFGYLVLFAPAFPLAPFLAFVNNVIEIRTSGFKMCFAYQRPKWRARSGIGSWLAVMNVLGFLAVITNASMITFVGDQDAKSNNLCAVEAVPYDDPKTEDVQEDLAGPDQLLKCPVMYDGEGVDLKTGEPIPPVYVDPDSDGMCYGCSGFLNRSQEWQLWLQFAITGAQPQKTRCALVFLRQSTHPSRAFRRAQSTPSCCCASSSSRSRRRCPSGSAMRARSSSTAWPTATSPPSTSRPNADSRCASSGPCKGFGRNPECVLAPDQEEYNQKMNDSLAVMKRQLRFRTEDDLLEMFNEQDQVSRAAPHHSPAGRLRLIRRLLLQDHSGAIDDRELKGFFASMNIMVRTHLPYSIRLAKPRLTPVLRCS